MLLQGRIVRVQEIGNDEEQQRKGFWRGQRNNWFKKKRAVAAAAAAAAAAASAHKLTKRVRENGDELRREERGNACNKKL